MPDTPPFLHLPPLNRTLSTRTGWGREHWEAVADHLLDSAARYATTDGAQVRLPGRTSVSGVVSDGLEGFARTFLLAAFRIAGARGVGVEALIERYARGVAAGSDPTNPGGWPPIVDRSQQMVEAASIALALHETRPWIFDRLDSSAQDNVRCWLGGFVGKRTWDNNWILFQVVTEQFLAGVGGPYDRTEIERGLDTIEAWYRGDGWYSDGAGANYDYYIGWAMHLYPLLWSRMVAATGGDDGGRGEVYRGRLREFLEQYQYFFGAGGAPVHQGRSLTYRFATAAPFWLGALCEATPLPPGRTRRLASDILRHFVERGAPDARGLLSLGWYGQFLPTTQSYSGPGSPYWASKGFLGLLLAPDHPVWTELEQEAPNDVADQVVAMPAPGFLLHSTRHDGIVRLLNHGSDHNPLAPAPAHDDPHYAKLSYSTHTGPGAGDSAWRLDIDNHLAVLGTDGTASRRTRIHRVAVFDRYAASWHDARVDGTDHRVETAVLARGAWQVRIHRITAGGTVPAVRDGGYTLAEDTDPTVATGALWATATRRDNTTSAMIGLYGFTGSAVHTDVDDTAFGPYSATPVLHAPTYPGRERIYVGLVVLSGDPVHPGALADRFRVTVTGAAVAVGYPDGELVQVRLGELPAPGAAPDDPLADPAVRYVRITPGAAPVVLRA